MSTATIDSRRVGDLTQWAMQLVHGDKSCRDIGGGIAVVPALQARRSTITAVTVDKWTTKQSKRDGRVGLIFASEQYLVPVVAVSNVERDDDWFIVVKDNGVVTSPHAFPPVRVERSRRWNTIDGEPVKGNLKFRVRLPVVRFRRSHRIQCRGHRAANLRGRHVNRAAPRLLLKVRVQSGGVAKPAAHVVGRLVVRGRVEPGPSDRNNRPRRSRAHKLRRYGGHRRCRKLRVCRVCERPTEGYNPVEVGDVDNTSKRSALLERTHAFEAARCARRCRIRPTDHDLDDPPKTRVRAVTDCEVDEPTVGTHFSDGLDRRGPDVLLVQTPVPTLEHDDLRRGV